MIQAENHFSAWLQEQRHADMTYLERVTFDLLSYAPFAKSVISVLAPYSTETIKNSNYEFARYLGGVTVSRECPNQPLRDYHHTLKSRLKRVFKTLPGEFRIVVDTSPINDRSLAYFAGLGFIGKNGLLIHKSLGSYFFIASVFYSEPLGLQPKPMKRLCGSCALCLESCPTNAFYAPGFLDANHCLSYLTIEKKGEFSLEEKNLIKHSKTLGYAQIMGCDICQEVCPFNLKRSKNSVKVCCPDFEDWDEFKIGKAFNRLKKRNF